MCSSDLMAPGSSAGMFPQKILLLPGALGELSVTMTLGSHCRNLGENRRDASRGLPEVVDLF